MRLTKVKDIILLIPLLLNPRVDYCVSPVGDFEALRTSEMLKSGCNSMWTGGAFNLNYTSFSMLTFVEYPD